MPAPSPSITAMIGAEVGMAMTAPTSSTSAVPATMPTAATTGGSPAATSEPNATMSTINAAPTPTSSAALVVGSVPRSMTMPRNSTSSPAARAPSAASSSRS